LKEGGEYKVVLTLTDGEKVTMSGKFIEVIPNKKLVYSWNNTSKQYPAENTLVTVEFIDQGNTTELRLKHSQFAKPLSAQGHTMGWGDALDKLASLFS
jgi:uncharacterized protein YndB with AHSA1/START domain